jgi:hypothetical protein
MIPAKINIVEKTNKSGVNYQMLEIWITTKDGEVVKIHEIFVRDSLNQILTILTKGVAKV